MMKIKNFRGVDVVIFFIFHTIHRFRRDDAFALSAEAAYYLIMSFIPFLIFLVNAILFFMAPQISLVMKGISHLPPDIATVMLNNVHRIIEARSSIWLFTGLIISFWAASQGMQILVQASDQTFHKDRNKQNWFRVKFKSMIFMLFLTFSILVSLVLMVFGNAAVYAIHHIFYLPAFFLQLWTLTKYVISVSSLIVTLTIFYHFAPYAFRPKWLRSFLISIFVTLLWLLLTAAYSYYMLHISQMGLTYGSLIGIIALFIWFRLIALSIITGSEILMAWQDFDILRKRNTPLSPS